MSPTTMESITLFARLVTHLFQAARLYPSEHPERFRLEREIETIWQQERRAWNGLRIDLTQRHFASGDGRKVALCPRTQKDLLQAAEEVGLQGLGLGPADEISDLILAIEELAAGRRPTHCLLEEKATEVSSAMRSGMRTQEIPATLPLAPMDTLREVWSDLVERRWYDGQKIDEVIREIMAADGDPIAAPVQLLGRGGVGEVELRHVLDVARLAYLTARATGADAGSIHEVVAAALLFDIGMLEVPPTLLTSAKRLTHSEFRVVQKHTTIGARILLAAGDCPELAAVVAFEHHMRPDGKGYPLSEGNWSVCDASKLIQVCDVYAALRSDRPSRPALGEEKARQLMRSLGGRWIDRKYLDVLLEQAIPAGTAAT